VQRIVIVGNGGSGRTQVGRRLAGLLGLEAVDLHAERIDAPRRAPPDPARRT
jgi:shikimate kinase